MLSVIAYNLDMMPRAVRIQVILKNLTRNRLSLDWSAVRFAWLLIEFWLQRNNKEKSEELPNLLIPDSKKVVWKDTCKG